MANDQEETLPTADATTPAATAVHDGAGVGLEEAQQVPILDTHRSFADSALYKAYSNLIKNKVSSPVKLLTIWLKEEVKVNAVHRHNLMYPLGMEILIHLTNTNTPSPTCVL